MGLLATTHMHTCMCTHMRAHVYTHMHTHVRAHTCTHACTLEPPTQPWPSDGPGARSESTDFLLRSPHVDLPFGHFGGDLCASFSYAALPFVPPILLTALPLSCSLSPRCSPGSCRGLRPRAPGVDAAGPQRPALWAPELVTALAGFAGLLP